MFQVRDILMLFRVSMATKSYFKKRFLHGQFPVLFVFHFFLSAFNLYRLLLFDADCFTTN